MHIMKTAGTSFARQINANFAVDEIYPAPTAERAMDEYWKVSEVRALGPDRRAGIRIFHGHFPLLVADLVGADTIVTLVRDPVERVISHLRHCERHYVGHHGRPLEAIYEDGWLHPHFFRNYQVKQFAMVPEDQPEAHNEVIDVDERRLEVARANLDRVAVLGLTERYPQFLREVVERFGWTPVRGLRLQASPGSAEVPEALRSRIREDNQADLAFYEDARERARSQQGRQR